MCATSCLLCTESFLVELQSWFWYVPLCLYCKEYCLVFHNFETSLSCQPVKYSRVGVCLSSHLPWWNYTNSLDFYQNIFIAEFRDVSLSILSSIFFYYLLSLVENSLFNRKTVFLRSTYVCGLFSICHLLSKLRQKIKHFVIMLGNSFSKIMKNEESYRNCIQNVRSVEIRNICQRSVVILKTRAKRPLNILWYVPEIHIYQKYYHAKSSFGHSQ